MDALRVDMGGDDFEPVGEYCAPEEEDDEEVLQAYGNDVLRQRYVWLNRKLR